MKTRATVSKFLKNLGVLGLISLAAVSCGKDNTSGQSSNASTTAGIYSQYPGYGNVYGTMTLDQIMTAVSAENPCDQGGTRVRVQIPLQMNVNTGSSYLGVTSFGDIAVAYNQAQPVIDLYICPRAGATGQGQLSYNPILETSTQCPVGQISAAEVILSGQVPYTLRFRPINSTGSSVCTGY